MKTSEQLAGILILVVGPSGAGKDTLIEAARERFATDDRFIFPRRYITRKGSTGEVHIALTPEQFSQKLEQKKFAIAWQAHSLSYAIGNEDITEARMGKILVINVSRKVVEDIRARFSPVAVIEITAPADVLTQRLRSRSRETDEEITNRVERSNNIRVVRGEHYHMIDNSTSLDDSIAKFNALLEYYAGTLAG